MFRIVYTQEFEESYARLPIQIQRKIEKQEARFRENPFHPSLRTEKLIPKRKELWSLRVDRSYRIVFRFLDNQSVVLINVGPHDRIYRIK